MALVSASPLSINPLTVLSSRRRPPKPPVSPIVCTASESRGWRAVVSTALAAAVISSSGGAMADLNKFEADVRGEFGIGSAAQFGSADLKKAVHVNENFRDPDAAELRTVNLQSQFPADQK